MVRVLFIDDDPNEHRTLAHVLPDPYTLLSAYTGREGLEVNAREGPDLVLLDINLPDLDGIQVLKAIATRPAAPPVVMLTGHEEPRVVKEAILGGACDYVVKPFDLAELVGTLRAAVTGIDARRAAVHGSQETVLTELIGESAGMRETRQLILRYAPSGSPVLVIGESGTGKELVARAIHQLSRRRTGPYVALNCGALPDTLLETELFGAERGAYTDAVTRPGSFEQANGGTLFLDEIGEFSASAQTRLLRVLEQKELRRVGATRSVPLDVRVVSATNRELKSEIRLGRFREDLYYRLGVLPIRLPPLRDRREDIPMLALHFLAALGRPMTRIASDAVEQLLAYPWPGNIRELRSVMERSALNATEETIRARDLSFD
ncbi:MAG TPA: sigma-54 dependent transcriptional regulator [Spirochaetia bacterium]|nr:sigma-54 dependent transcriptional regulator [Spirochaetia bacterium]